MFSFPVYDRCSECHTHRCCCWVQVRTWGTHRKDKENIGLHEERCTLYQSLEQAEKREHLEEALDFVALGLGRRNGRSGRL